MKKILVLILALVMIMSLTACGGGEEIEITMDNVDQYFEIKDNVVTFPENKFGEYEAAEVQHYVALKTEYADRINLEETQLLFEVTNNEYETGKPEIDFENKTFKPADVSEDIELLEKEVIEYCYYKNLFDYDNEIYYVGMSAYTTVYNMDDPHFETGFHTIDRDFEFTNVKGTLVLK